MPVYRQVVRLAIAQIFIVKNVMHPGVITNLLKVH